MIIRQKYLDQLTMYLGSDFIKILTGARRVGKSTMLLLLKQHLINKGAKEEQFIEINYEKLSFDKLKDGQALHEYVKERIIDKKQMYLFVDEIQELPKWAPIINSLRVSFGCDIYITGSNARMFSGEHLTYLSGRYVEIKIYPLSFKEFIEFRNYKSQDITKSFNEYLKVGSFPAVALTENEQLIDVILAGLIDSILGRDIILRGKIRDEGNFFKFAKFIFENIGNQTSANKIKNTMISEGHSITSDTVDNYLKLMCDAHMLYQCERYDIRGKERLKTNGKYYVVDMGLRNKLLGYKPTNLGHIIENIVYLQLIREGNTVYIGKNMTTEVDFMAVKSSQIKYIQVALTALEEKTLDREMRALNSIADQYPKYLITMDKIDLSQNGIIHINLLDFLLEKVKL
ncbi:MAG: ATP-binding protein [Christensenellales bacterium]|jgi:predicted AAA+ superfamily ATPase|nr:ATP-binding protein [Clostridiales bacterium]